MVTYKLISQTSESKLIYEYYPENDISEEGIIQLDCNSGEISVVKVSKKDIKRYVSAAQLNDMRDSINRMRIEAGEEPLSEDELPAATEDEEFFVYADHAMKKIIESYKQGNVEKEGSSIWY